MINNYKFGSGRSLINRIRLITHLIVVVVVGGNNNSFVVGELVVI